MTVHSARVALRAVFTVLVLGAFTGTASMQAPTGVISGTVVAAGSKAPLAGAIVRIVSTRGAETASATVATGEKGEFTFPNLAPGRYWVTASKARYLTLGYGQRPGSGLPGVSIAIGSGAPTRDVTIPLPLASVITGTVLDERGDPAMGANVAARLLEWRNGERAVRDVSFDLADDRGQFRITNLPPGSYVVTAARGAVNPDIIPLIYFPGTVAASQAMTIEVGVGDERAGVNLSFPAAAGMPSFSGQVVSRDGQTVNNARVSIIAKDVAIRGLDVRQTFASRNGEFRLGHLVPGDYRLIATTSDLELIAARDISLGTSPVEKIELTMGPGSTISGLVTGIPAEATSGPRVSLAALTESGRPASNLTGRADAQGRFVLRGVVPGQYVVVLSDLPPGYRIASLVRGAGDAHDLPITVNPLEDIADIRATMGAGSTTLSGTLFDSAGAPTPDYLVVVFSEDQRYWWPGSPRIKADQPATDGRFTFADLPPGRYRLAVVTDAQPSEWLAPEFLKKLEPASVRVSLEAGKAITQDLRMK